MSLPVTGSIVWAMGYAFRSTVRMILSVDSLISTAWLGPDIQTTPRPGSTDVNSGVLGTGTVAITVFGTGAVLADAGVATSMGLMGAASVTAVPTVHAAR